MKKENIFTMEPCYKSGLNKSINDAGWGKFTDILKYKALVMGKTIIAVNPRRTPR